MSTPDQRQDEWDEHVTTALDAARTDDEATGIATVVAARHRAWDLHHAAGDGPERAA